MNSWLWLHDRKCRVLVKDPDGKVIFMDDSWNNRASAEMTVLMAFPGAKLNFIRSCSDFDENKIRKSNGDRIKELNDEWERNIAQSYIQRDHPGVTMNTTQVPAPGLDESLPQCVLCEKGFRLVNGKHIPSQSLGMIPVTPCVRERFHYRGFVVRVIDETVDVDLARVQILDGGDRTMIVKVRELWKVNDYMMLHDS